MKIKTINIFTAVVITLCVLGLFTNQAYAAQRKRPQLNDDRTTFVGDSGQPLRGPFTSTEWTSAVPYDQIANIKNLGFNAVHLYAECFDANYPKTGSTAPGYAAAEVDKIVEATRELGLYLVITIGNGANNGSYNLKYVEDFWTLYAKRYAKETHVLFEVQNEPVAWGPPYSAATATPTGAVDMEIAAYKVIRKYAPDTPILLFSYSVPWGRGGAVDAMKDIRIFNKAVFGNENAVWSNEAVAFHGYSGWSLTSEFVASMLKEGYPCFMTEFAGGAWGSGKGGLDAALVSELEYYGISWLTFQYIPPTGVSDNIAEPVHYAAIVENSGLSWKPDYGSWPSLRGVYGNDGRPRKTAEFRVGDTMIGTTHIEAEDFDWGGDGISYHDSDSTNDGSKYRSDEAVDLQVTSDTDGGYDVCSIAEGEWLEYTIWVQNPGYYDLSLRVASSSTCKVQINGRNQDNTGVWELTNTGGLQKWETTTHQVFLGLGIQKLRIDFLSDGLNLNWIELSPVKKGPVADGTYKFLNRYNALSMMKDVNGDSVSVTEYSDSEYQQWNIKHTGGGQYRLTAKGNRWSMDKVIIIPIGNGYYYLTQADNGLNLQSTLASGGSVVDKGAYNGEANQQWGIFPTSASAFPSGLSAIFESSGQVVKLTWNAMTGATGYNIKRSVNNGGPYKTIATGITETNYTDTHTASGRQYYYVINAVTGDGETLDSAEAVLHFPGLTGTTIGTEGSWSNSGNTIAKVFDADLNTFFDAPTGNDCFVGLDFGSDMNKVITQISYCPRSDFPNRMVGGIFQGANQSDFSDAVLLHTITVQPVTGAFTSVEVTAKEAFRYVRYLSPKDGFGNVAELQFFGYSPADSLSSVELEKAGDINSDGQIDSIDLLLMKKHILGIETIQNIKSADLNSDEVIDALDYVIMKRFLSGVITGLPVAAQLPNVLNFLVLDQSNIVEANIASSNIAQTNAVSLNITKTNAVSSNIAVEETSVFVSIYENNLNSGRGKHYTGLGHKTFCL
jgi:hypothetical protein